MVKFLRGVLVLSLLAGSAVNAADEATGKTWALLIGISKYAGLPRDLWLQYPDSDARALREFLESPRGGAVPPERTRLLTNEQATLKAIRAAFGTFLKDGPGRSDTVYVLVAGHGTVDDTGAYILASNSDPLDLAHTALPMAELHNVVEDELNRAGRVILLADVCRAATIMGQRTASLGAVVEKIGEAPGEMLGLMAARPKELSFEGPQYGGGHGAFTWSVLRGLGGAADSNHDGSVTAGELIDFVATDVPRLTSGRQHPRDFGNMENTTRLSIVQ